MKILYSLGRIFQLIGLLALPFSMWITQFEHNEAKAIGILVGSLLVFAIGTVLARLGLNK